MGQSWHPLPDNVKLGWSAAGRLTRSGSGSPQRHREQRGEKASVLCPLCASAVNLSSWCSFWFATRTSHACLPLCQSPCGQRRAAIDKDRGRDTSAVLSLRGLDECPQRN